LGIDSIALLTPRSFRAATLETRAIGVGRLRTWTFLHRLAPLRRALAAVLRSSPLRKSCDREPESESVAEKSADRASDFEGLVENAASLQNS
jgi:hypothetical protein